MSLPTPPGTSHRVEKENKRPGPSRVVWAEHHEYHTLTTDLPQRASLFSPSTSTPTKSILKKTVYAALCSESDEREATPEPQDPLVNLHYLDSPVARLLAVDAGMRDLIEAYNILAARLRASVSDETDADASWPLFQPLRKHRDTLTQAICRDLGRALEDPLTENEVKEQVHSLPSPQKSPKKRGMTAEQAKHARDLCTITHAVLKLLALFFTLPCLYGVFEDAQLGDMLTAVLGIPLAPRLPTPNARKTCALAIYLIQAQRLPAEVLMPARTRIAYALRRGIEGELGKEGKKGSASDGLKAIHDLSIHYPTVFVPAFVDIMPSVFTQLLAPTVTLRLQACHAMSGFAFGLASLPPSAVHTRAASIVSYFLTKAPLGSPSKKPGSPTKDPLIIRTLRTTLAATEPKHSSQGPVWALCVLSGFVIMLGAQLFLDERMTKCISALLSHSMRHPKSSVRALVCLMWRCVAWAYFQPPSVKLVPVSDDEDAELEEVEYTEEERVQHRQRIKSKWHVMRSVVDMGAGVSTISALLGSATGTCYFDEALEQALGLLKEMTNKGGPVSKEALDTVATLVGGVVSGDSSLTVFDIPETLDDDWEWNPMKLLPLALFSANPGLLTVDYGQLASVVRPIFADCPHVEDIRCLTRGEITMDWVFDSIISIWKDGLGSLVCSWNTELPTEILDIWSGLWSASVAAAQTEYNSESLLADLANRAIMLLILVLRNDKLDFSGGKSGDDADFVLPGPSNAAEGLPKYRWKAGLRLRFARELWRRTRCIFADNEGILLNPASKLLNVLDRKEAELVGRMDLADEVRVEWALLCADVVAFCEEKEMLAFWGLEPSIKRRSKPWSDGVRAVVWTNFVQKWIEEPMSWESSVVLLGAPFLDMNAWDMTSDELDQWDAFLRLTMDRALDNDNDVDSISVIDHVASIIAPHGTLSLLSSTRISDLLLSHLDVTDARTIPQALCELINDTLDSAYPPTEDNKLPTIWLLRTVTRTLDACPVELIQQLLETVQDGLCRWIADDAQALTEQEYSLDIVPVYQTATVILMSLPAKSTTVEKFSGLLVSGFVGRDDKPETVAQAFRDLWESTFAKVAPPKSGWSDKVVACLRATGFLPSEEAELESGDAEEVEDQLLTIPPSDDLFVSPVVLSPTTLAAPFAFTSPVRRLPGLPYPTTPTSCSRTVTPPPRPRKTVSPVRPMAPLVLFESPSRSPVTPKRRTPGSPIKKADKENASPLHLIASVAERIAQRSPLAAGPSVLGKRSFDAEDDEPLAERVKKVRKDVLRPLGLAPFAGPLPKSRSMPEANSRKRKGALFEAVEVPTLREIMHKSVSFDSSAASSAARRPIAPLPKVVRRTQSATKLGEASSSGLISKRKRTASLPEPFHGSSDNDAAEWNVSDDEVDNQSASSSLSSPLRNLRNMQAIGSDDSIMMDAADHFVPDMPSSDDDPHRFLGQVTPHRLVSPALRRVKVMDAFDADLGSDDSNMSASPTTERVARMSQQKTKPCMTMSPRDVAQSPLMRLNRARC